MNVITAIVQLSLVTYYLEASSYVAFLNRQASRLNRLEAKRLKIKDRLRSFDVEGRVLVDADRLDPKALIFQMKPEILVDYARICNVVSLTGQGKVEPLAPNDQMTIAGAQYNNVREFKRGRNQVSGYLLASKSRGKTSFVASFAGTSSKIDIAHISMLAEAILHDTSVHRGLHILVYRNIDELNSHIEKERLAGHEVDLTLAGHSLGGAISILGIFDLKKRWIHDRGVHIKCLNLAGPSPFMYAEPEELLSLIGYNNLLNIYRKADYVYQGAVALGMLGLGPTLYLQDKPVEGEQDLPVIKRIKETFRSNHYVSEFVRDFEASGEDVVWTYITVLEELAKVNKEINKIRMLASANWQGNE